MIVFFENKNHLVFAVETKNNIDTETSQKLSWLFSGAEQHSADIVNGTFIGPRKEMITPWSTNAVEITQNMGIEGIIRIEQFVKTTEESPEYDPMLSRLYQNLDQNIYTINKQPDPIIEIDDIKAYNDQEGLALSEDEISYLEGLSKKLGRKLTDSEIFGFSQVNSEH